MVYGAHGESGGGAAGLRGARSATDARSDVAAQRAQRSRGGAAARRPPAVGESMGAAAGGCGACRTEAGRPRWPQAEAPPGRSSEDRAQPPAWARSARLRHEFVDRVASSGADRGDVRGEVSSRPRLAPPQAARLELPAADGPRPGARRGGDPSLEARALAGA